MKIDLVVLKNIASDDDTTCNNKETATVATGWPGIFFDHCDHFHFIDFKSESSNNDGRHVTEELFLNEDVVDVLSFSSNNLCAEHSC